MAACGNRRSSATRKNRMPEHGTLDIQSILRGKGVGPCAQPAAAVGVLCTCCPLGLDSCAGVGGESAEKQRPASESPDMRQPSTSWRFEACVAGPLLGATGRHHILAGGQVRTSSTAPTSPTERQSVRTGLRAFVRCSWPRSRTKSAVCGRKASRYIRFSNLVVDIIESQLSPSLEPS